MNLLEPSKEDRRRRPVMKYRNVRDKKQRGKLHEQEAVGQRNATLEARWQRVVTIVWLSSLRRDIVGFFNHQLAEQGQKTSELLHIPSGSLITLRVIVIAAKPNGKNLKLIS
jgi:hypothetical protein